jgi:hypothetical protein
LPAGTFVERCAAIRSIAEQAAEKVLWDSHSWLSSGGKCNKQVQPKVPAPPNSARNRIFFRTLLKNSEY